MHIAQGMLKGAICPVTAGISIAVVGIASYFALKSKDKPDAGKFFKVIALIFVMQMLNFPIQNGTSGHFLGGTFAAVILGTPFAVIAMTIILTVQTFLFGDGGINALGANILNMAIIGTLIPGIVLNYFNVKDSIKKYGTIAIVSMIAVVLSSFACALEAGISGIFPIFKGITAMISVHAVIGAVEGVITVAICMLATKGVLKTKEYIFMILSLVIATPFASSSPDGLEWVVEKIGKLTEAGMIYKPIFNDYAMPIVQNNYISTIISAIAGILLMGIITSLLYVKKLNKR